MKKLTDFELIELSKTNLRRKMEEIEQQASSFLLLKKDMENVLDVVQSSFEERLKEAVFKEKDIERKEKAVKDQFEEVKVKEEEFELVKKCYEERVREVELKEKAFEFEKKSFERQREDLAINVENCEQQLKEVKLMEKGVKDKLEEVWVKEEEFGFKEKSFKKRCVEFETKEKALEKRVKDKFDEIGLKEKDLEKCFREYELKEKRFRERRVEFESKEKAFEKRCRDLEYCVKQCEVVKLKEKSVNDKLEEIWLKEIDLEKCLREYELKEKSFQQRCMEFELEEKILKERYRDVEVAEKTVQKQLGEIKRKEEELGQRCRDVESSENRLWEVLKDLELKSEQCEDRFRELKLREESIETRFGKLKEKEEQFRERSKDFELNRNGLEAKEKTLAEWSKELERKANLASAVLPQLKTEAAGSLPVKLSVDMDSKGLQKFINERWKEHGSISTEVAMALQLAADPAKLVFDVMEWFYSPHLSKGDSEFEENVARRSCIVLLEQLFKLSPEIKPHVRQEAIKFAFDWITKLKVESGHEFEVLGFLWLLASFKLADFFDVDELFNFSVFVAQHIQIPELIKVLGLEAKITGFITKLVEKKQHTVAIRFVHAFGKVHEFPPVPMLKEFLGRILEMGKTDPKTQNKAHTQKISDLRDVVKCIEDHKLESEYQPHNLNNLKDFIVSLTSPALCTAPECEIQPQQHVGIKRPREFNATKSSGDARPGVTSGGFSKKIASRDPKGSKQDGAVDASVGRVYRRKR